MGRLGIAVCAGLGNAGLDEDGSVFAVGDCDVGGTGGEVFPDPEAGDAEGVGVSEGVELSDDGLVVEHVFSPVMAWALFGWLEAWGWSRFRRYNFV